MPRFYSRAGQRFDEQYQKHLLRRFSGLSSAPLFNSLGENDMPAVVWIYRTKALQGEFPEDIREDKVRCIESVAKEYIAQKCAFSEVLTREGFDIVSEALRDYSGRIATLSNHGTFTMFGKEGKHGRKLTMKRIHSPELDYNGSRGKLLMDLKLGEGVVFLGENGKDYGSSYLRGIAINPNGPSDDGLEVRAFQTIFGNIEVETRIGIELPDHELIRHGQEVKRR